MSNKASIIEIPWNEAKQTIRSVNPALWKTMEDINPDKSFTVFKAKYPYGSKICHYGLFHVPCKDGTVVPINSKRYLKNLVRHYITILCLLL